MMLCMVATDNLKQLIEEKKRENAILRKTDKTLVQQRKGLSDFLCEHMC